MELLIETFKDFFGIVEGKFVIATVVMSVIILLIIYLLFVVTVSFRKRKEALSIHLPDINEHGEIVKEEAGFNETEEVTVELIDASEDEVFNDDVKVDDKSFLTALTMETGVFISDDETTNSKVIMPNVGEIDYEQIKDEKRKEKEQEVINHLRKVAQADSEEELARIDNLSLNSQSLQK